MGPSVPDLIAATAQLFGSTSVHVDKHFDTITAVTGQPATPLAYTSTPNRGIAKRTDNWQ
jgi:hypothetical protein